jgi:hypothetical protein
MFLLIKEVEKRSIFLQPAKLVVLVIDYCLKNNNKTKPASQPVSNGQVVN